MSTGAESGPLPPDVWARDLARRLELATPEDSVRGMFLRGMLESVRELGDEALVQRCLEACGHENFVDFFSYPTALELRIISVALEPLAVRYGSFEEGLRMLGRHAVNVFLCSHAGRMLVMVAGGNPKMLVTSAPTCYRFGASYGQHHLQWMGQTRCLWTMKREFKPYPYQEGVFMAFLEKTSARNVRVVGRKTGDLDSELDISWE